MAERRGLRRLALGLACALTAATLTLAAASSLGAGLTERSERTKPIEPGAEAAAEASCPKGSRRHLISGAFASGSPWRVDENSTIAIFGSAPAGSAGWRIGAANFAGERERASASVLCGKRNPRVRVSKESARVAPGDRATATAGCRRSEEAIAGGFAAPKFSQRRRAAEVVAIASRRKGARKWRVEAFNNSISAKGKIVAYARCAKRRPRLQTVKLKDVSVDRAPLELAPRCEPGTQLWSGGFEASYGGADPFAATIADRSYADGRRWVSRFVGFQSRDEITAFAYCAPR